MISSENIDVLLNELAKVIKDQQDTILIQKYQLDSIKDKLTAAEELHKEKIEKR